MGVLDRPLKIPDRPAPVVPARSFHSFIRRVLTTFLAFVLAWKLLFFPKKTGDKSIENNNNDPDLEMASQPGPSSVLGLLTTDTLPESSSSSGEERPAPPPPQLLQAPTLPAYLDTINEEESDDLRSLSSTSFASPRTVIDTTRSSTENIDRQSLTSSRLSDSDYRSPEAASPLQVDKAIGAQSPFIADSSPSSSTASAASSSSESQPHTAIAIETPHNSEAAEEVKLEVEDVLTKEEEVPAQSLFNQSLLKELAKLGQDNQTRTMADDHSSPSSSSSERSIISRVAQEMAEAEKKKERKDSIPTLDADRDQDEELVYNEERRKTVTMDDNLSLNSVSINLDATKDSILNNSVTSNPLDESSIVMQSTSLRSSERPTERPPSPPYDLPPPPPDLQSPRQAPPPPPPPPVVVPPPLPSSPPPPPPAHQERSPIRPAPPPPSILNKTPLLKEFVPLGQAPPVPSPPDNTSIPLMDSEPVARNFVNYDRQDQGMSSPPNEPPPPPPKPATMSIRSGFSSREDLLSEAAAPSRSTIREIPVQRAPSAAPSQQSTVLEYRMPSTYVPPANDGDEYYRREVISRTIITKSTEALSQPPLGRSSPIERYITYPDPHTREERTVDYKVTIHRDIEEEERRIREEQDRRKAEEADRRRREEESRREWELKEQEVLDRLRRDRELKEREVQRHIIERERAEKERIERDRLDRERHEMQRRAEWERIENERRNREEAELARKRAIEKERLDRERAEEERRERERLEIERRRMEQERLEAERREAERQEKIRIERERLERERIEIERIERIKRETIEREKRERERELAEQERLRKEREELERLERERRQLEIEERAILEQARREAEERERQRLEDEAKEARRREEERREAELLADIQRQAEERERLRRKQEREEQERLERIRREQQRIEEEKADADRRERERLEEERREKELLEAQRRAKEKREQDRLDDIERERLRLEEERKEKEKREIERRAAQERERQRRMEEEAERLRLLDIQRASATRDAQRRAEQERIRERDELEREARRIAEMERRENERRERERAEEERSLAELRDKERRNQEIRDRERAEAAAREENRKLDDRRSRDKLDHIVRERSKHERFEQEKRRLLAENEAMNRKKYDLTSPETLAKLTRAPYFSRDNLNTEVTTKVERQVIERVNRDTWVEDYRYPTSTQNAIQYSLDSTNEDNTRDRLYDRNGSTRNSRYRDRTRMEKARRDFLSGAPESSDMTDQFLRSTDDISTRARPEFRGPLLQKFHDSEFKSKPELEQLPYSRVGPSQSGEVQETHMDEVHRRSGSVVDYNRMSRRDVTDGEVAPVDSHTRSRSADYLMDRRLREETEPPENELQKAMEHSPRNDRVSEHELRFRKSTEKLTVPEWYRENRPTVRPTDVDLTLPRQRTESYSHQYSSPGFNYTSGGYGQPLQAATPTMDMPRGMFDRYKEEIEDMRRSRSSLHQIAQPEHHRQEVAPSPMPRRSLSQEVISSVHFMENTDSRALPGYTVSEIPGTWNIERTRSSRVIEVADTFVGPKQMIDQHGNVTMRYGGRVTIEEVLDSIFQQTPPSAPVNLDTSLPMADNVYQGNTDGPGIYTKNYMLMDKVMKQPEIAESLLKSESLFVRCSYCHRTRDLPLARMQFVSCKHCYTYYCSRDCRLNDWHSHTNRCSFARINTLCKDVIMKVREDPRAQACMSRIARDGFATCGRGSVNIRLSSPQVAQAYVSQGWMALQDIPPQQLLYYYTVQALIQEKKEPSLVALCKRYDPNEKFILSVSIIADIENCPSTPPPETVHWTRTSVQPARASSMQDFNQYNRQQRPYNPYSPVTLVPTDV